MTNLQQFTDYVHRFPDCQTCEDTLRILEIKVHRMEGNELEFDIIGLKPYVGNAIRQTILNDIPTMAIEEVYFHKNSSMFNCDYISQRLALVPIKADPNDFKFVYNADMAQLNSDNALVLNLNVTNTGAQPAKVYSRSLVWEPIGEKQKALLSPIEPLFGSIPLLYLKPNEEISCRVFCVKGLGRNHMKFCPGFSRYSFLSKIDINQANFTPNMALTLQQSFPPGVIDLRPMPNGELKPFVANARLDRHSRAYKNNENVEKNISVKYYRDHLIFTVESYGVIEPDKIVSRSLSVLKYKYTFWRNLIQKVKNGNTQ